MYTTSRLYYNRSPFFKGVPTKKSDFVSSQLRVIAIFGECCLLYSLVGKALNRFLE
jgi:hypothetical protein